MYVDKLGIQNTFSSEKNGENILILSVLTELKDDQFDIYPLKFPNLSKQIYETL